MGAEISTGLDSSTTFQIVKCTRNFSHMMKVRRCLCLPGMFLQRRPPELTSGIRQGTVLMALLQPPPEVYELFDDIMLLSEGMPGAWAGLSRAYSLLAHQFRCVVPTGGMYKVLGIL